MSDGSPITDTLIDQIYGALLGEANWHEFLDSLRTILPNGQAVLFYHDLNRGTGAVGLSSGIDLNYTTSYEAHYSRINPWMKGASTRPIGLGVSAKSMLPHEELLRTEFYHDWLKPQGLASAVGITLARERDCNFLLSITHRDVEDRDALMAAQVLQTIAPHLKRAFGFYRRNGSAGTALLGGGPVFDALRIGVLTLGHGGTVKSANIAASQLLDANEAIWTDRTGRFQCASPDVMSVLKVELSLWTAGPQTLLMKTWLMARPNGKLPLRITMFRPSRSALEAYFSGPEIMLLLEEPTSNGTPSTDLISRHFGLTRAEHRVMAAIAEGRTLDEIAIAFAVSIGTVRSQAKSIFAKLGVQRQADIVRIVHLLGRSATAGE